MINPKQTLNNAISGVEDFFTPPAKKAALTYIRPAATSTPTYKFARPKTSTDVMQGRNNARDMSKLPKGTVIGAPTPQSKALQSNLK